MSDTVTQSAPVSSEATPQEPKAPEQNVEGKVSAEQKAAEQPTEKKPDDRLGAKFAALSKREKEIVAREKALKDNQSKYDAFEKAKAEALKNPAKFLEETGLTVNDILKYTLYDKPTPEMEQKALRDRVEAIEKQRQEDLSRAEEAEKRKIEQQTIGTINQYRIALESLVKNEPDKYETVASEGYEALELAWAVVEADWDKKVVALAADKILTPQQKNEKLQNLALTPAQALDFVEQHLWEKDKEKFIKSKKIAAYQAELKAAEEAEKAKAVIYEMDHTAFREITPTLTNKPVEIKELQPSHVASGDAELIARAAKKLKFR